ncbi:MAG: tRNA 2-selenouridine(34) synthase MnmH [Bacteroidales bacterium]|nr:tRNA 2-selenouridine(34) synthase MnmH [Bacteroidales bacterium]MCF8455373.1 tRNA 2-selenouridine(34) synthase MnmH [Bacteroidales bacterium]
MSNIVSCAEFLTLQQKNIAIVDVRTPAEYKLGHIPQAFNVPLFSDEERVVVGTKYKQENKEAAILQGLDYVGPKMSGFIKSLQRITQKKEVLLHCWRGGHRSRSMAWLFELVGYTVYILDGGYKAYRNFMLESFSQRANLIILGGMTGSGKSDILNAIHSFGHQIIDLESIAHHKGSAFGAIGQKEQPTPQQFENNLFAIWQGLDLSKVIWLEDESASIGKTSIPSPLFQQIRSSKVIKIEVEKDLRVKRLVSEYAVFGKDELKMAVRKIEKRLGNLSTMNCLEAIDNDDFETAVTHILRYYDKAYSKGLSNRDQETVYSLSVEGSDTMETARKIIQFAKEKSLI